MNKNCKLFKSLLGTYYPELELSLLSSSFSIRILKYMEKTNDIFGSFIVSAVFFVNRVQKACLSFQKLNFALIALMTTAVTNHDDLCRKLRNSVWSVCIAHFLLPNWSLHLKQFLASYILRVLSSKLY